MVRDSAQNPRTWFASACLGFSHRGFSAEKMASQVRVRSLISYHGEDSSDGAGKGGGTKASSERSWGPVQGHSVPPSPDWHTSRALAMSAQGLHAKGRVVNGGLCCSNAVNARRVMCWWPGRRGVRAAGAASSWRGREGQGQQKEGDTCSEEQQVSKGGVRSEQRH